MSAAKIRLPIRLDFSNQVKIIKVTGRIKAMVEMMPSFCNLVVDIGTDHAYLPILLISQGKAKKIIAIDISDESLKQARKNIQKYGYEKEIELRLGDGLSPMQERESPDVIVAAGIGSRTLIKILEKGKNFWYSSEAKLLLQPMSNVRELREYLVESNYKIDNEELVQEKGKFFYPVIFSVPGKEKIEDELFLEIGPRLLDNPTYEVIKYIDHLLNKKSKIITSLKKAQENEEETKKKYTKVVTEYEKLKEVKKLVHQRLAGS